MIIHKKACISSPFARKTVNVCGDIVDGEMMLNDAGRIVADAWQWLEIQYDHVALDAWTVMPNHFHGIIVINNHCRDGSRRGGSRTAPTTVKRKPLGRLIGVFKTMSIKRINVIRNTQGTTLWQRNYYEHVIRNKNELNRIR